MSLIFQKPGETPNPVRALVHPKNPGGGWVTQQEWIRDAHGIWTDIAQTDVLDVEHTKGDKHEKHVCPLQIQVVNRCVRLYTNPIAIQPDVTVLDPFMGIGTTAYVCTGAPSPVSGLKLEAPRNVVGFELKESYHRASLAYVQRGRAARISERRGREPLPAGSDRRSRRRPGEGRGGDRMTQDQWRENLRPCWFCEMSGKPWLPGHFHRWLQAIEGDTSCTVGVIEDGDGCVLEIWSGYIRFTADKPSEEGGVMVQRSLFPGMTYTGATISPCGLYRYRLWRGWNPELPTVNFVMLNPSTADDAVDDPTIRRCLRYAGTMALRRCRRDEPVRVPSDRPGRVADGCRSDWPL